MRNADDGGEVPAGRFSTWLASAVDAIRLGGSSDVPCDGCTACCTSAQFVHIAPDETDTLAHVPAELQFPAPGLPASHVVLGYDDHGRCPMLTDRGCSIYPHRPRTCRTYDCRVFAATGVQPGARQVAIGRRAGRWRFDEPAAADREQRAAVRAAARHLEGRGGSPTDPTQIAVLAVEIHEVFLEGEPDAEQVAAAVARARRPPR